MHLNAMQQSIESQTHTCYILIVKEMTFNHHKFETNPHISVGTNWEMEPIMLGYATNFRVKIFREYFDT